MSGCATHQIAVMGAIADRTVTIDELAHALPVISRKDISDAAGRLLRRDYLERLETGVYRLTLTGRQSLAAGAALTSGPHRGRRKHPAYADTLQQRAWNGMRLLQRFTIGDINQLAARSGYETSEAALQKFVNRLTHCGYVTELPLRRKGTAVSSNGFKQFRLVRDTGAAAPRWLDASRAFKDWNTREIFPWA